MLLKNLKFNLLRSAKMDLLLLDNFGNKSSLFNQEGSKHSLFHTSSAERATVRTVYSFFVSGHFS